MSEQERDALKSLIIGRIFRMGSRPTQPGDVKEYDRCVRLFMDIHEGIEPDPPMSMPYPGWNFGGKNTGRIE